MTLNMVLNLQSELASRAIREGKRLDGRQFDEYRKITIETDISKNAEASARVKIGETEVVCGTKCLPNVPYPDTPDEGSITVGLEYLPIAHAEFEPGPPQAEAIEIARVVDRGIREAKAIDFGKLVIKEGELIWNIYVDIYTLNRAGNFMDACAIAAIKTLSDTRMPKLDASNHIVKGEYAKKLELSRLPLEVTFYKVADKIILDATLAEEKAASARFTVAVSEDDFMSAFQKGGSGGFSQTQINSCVELAFKKTKELRKIVFK
ncbi:MAG: exosome complex protein Rrp42 [Candidatus Diapherotrites archaeon]|nr:exosome complex protein Rrp42 [Candidatus Diapherotrites archaeon]